MKMSALEAIPTLTFTVNQAAEALGLNEASAKVGLSRYAKSGFILRLKRGEYIMKSRWQGLDEIETFQIANRLQVPSYISLLTALAYHGYTTQVPRDIVESMASMRSCRIQVKDKIFRYVKIPERFYRNFTKQDEIFIATPEKALLDALHLMSLGRYRLDLSAIDIDRFDRKRLMRAAKIYPGLDIGRWVR